MLCIGETIEQLNLMKDLVLGLCDNVTMQMVRGGQDASRKNLYYLW